MRLVRFVGAASLAGAAWLGFALVMGDDDPLAKLGLASALVTLVGGWASTSAAPLLVRLLVCGVATAATRAAAGPLPASLVAALITLGWGLRVRFRDGVFGLAAFGAGVGALSRPSWRLLAAFFVLGIASIGLHRLARRWRRGPADLSDESRGKPTVNSDSAAARLWRRLRPFQHRGRLAGRLQS